MKWARRQGTAEKSRNQVKSILLFASEEEERGFNLTAIHYCSTPS